MSFARPFSPACSGERSHTAKGFGLALLLALSVAAALGSVPAAHATSTPISITAANGSSECVSGFLGSTSASWSSSTDTCSSTGTFSLSTGSTLDVGAGVTLASSTSGGAYGFYISGGTVNNYGKMTGSSATGNGLSSHGTINNYGTITASSSAVGSEYGIYSSGTINNYGSITGTDDTHEGLYNPGTINNDGTLKGTGNYVGIVNYGTINSYGTVTGSGVVAGTGISNHGIIDNEGTLKGVGGPSGSSSGGYGIYNPDTINNRGAVVGTGVGVGLYNSGALNDYCGSTVSSSAKVGNSPVILPCPLPPIPSYATPGVLTLTSYGGVPMTGNKVGMIGPGQVIYSIPSVNQTLLYNEIAQGNFTLFPNTVSACSTLVKGETYIRVSGFYEILWGGPPLNSTEFILSNYHSYLTGPQGWPTEPACPV